MAARLGGGSRGGRHRRRNGRGGPGLLIGVLAVLTVTAVIVAVVGNFASDSGRRSSALGRTSEPIGRLGGSAPTPTGAASTSASGRASSANSSPASGASTEASAPAGNSTGHGSSSGTASGRPPVLTAGKKWWGVDSSGPITHDSIGNVADWYRGARPQFWGRYLMGHYAVTRNELALARAQHIFVYLIVNDRNCSGCSGGDACGNDVTSSQARDDAQDAIRSARRLDVPAGVVLFKDIEQVSSCHGEPTSTYLRSWYRTVRGSAYRTGFYGNTFRPFYEFPVAYCAAVQADKRFAADVVLDMNQPEPQLGAPRGTIGPHNAPRFAPSEPPCTPAGHTVIWQYGESVDSANLTDVDQALPSVTGLLAPDGSVS